MLSESVLLPGNVGVGTDEAYVDEVAFSSDRCFRRRCHRYVQIAITANWASRNTVPATISPKNDINVIKVRLNRQRLLSYQVH